MLVDYLPANLEFLGCRGVDNSTSGPEYAGSGGLGGTAPTGCVFPNRVSTVSNPNTGTTALTGVFTRVEWALGDLDPDETVTIRYAAGVPLRENAMDWSRSTRTPVGGAPLPESLGLQASNLDNNVGGTTRETIPEKGAKNTARVQGTYTGPFAAGSSNPVSDETTHTVTVEDVAMQKTADTSTFTTTGIVKFTMKVRVSEYVNASNIGIQDILPNGYCPLSSTTNYDPDSVPGCDPTPGMDPVGANYASVTPLPSGEFDIRFTPLNIAANGTASVSFYAKMRTFYSPGTTIPTVSGDSFTNTAKLATATTTPIVTTPPVPGTGETGPVTVGDESGWTQTTDKVSINKKILPRKAPPVGTQDCTDNTYVDADQINAVGFDKSTVAFRKGDRVCFELNVVFPTTINTRNAVVTDIVPTGTRYEAGSQTLTGLAVGGYTFDEVDAVAGGVPTWALGFESDGSRFTPAGTVVTIRFSVIVEDTATSGTVDITGNLMKMRTVSTSGAAVSYRDDVPFGLISAPPVPVVKGVAALNVAPINMPPAPIAPAATGVDGTNVAEGDRVTFRVDIKNDGTAANFNNYSIHGLQVWDVLPAGITCANVPAANIGPVSSAPGAPVGVCTNPTDGGHPTFVNSGTLSAIVWTFRTDPAGRRDDAIPSGATRTLTYDMIIPSPSSILHVYTNTAAVRSFDAYTNKAVNDVSTYFPSSNIDTTVLPEDTTGYVSQDTSNVVVNDAIFTKTFISTGLTEQNNNNSQAVNGETVTYRVRLDVLPHTSVFNGRVTDPLAAATWVTDSTSIDYYPDAADGTSAVVTDEHHVQYGHR